MEITVQLVDTTRDNIEEPMEETTVAPTVEAQGLPLQYIATNSNAHFQGIDPWELLSGPDWNQSDIEECSPVEPHPGDTEDSFREGP